MTDIYIYIYIIIYYYNIIYIYIIIYIPIVRAQCAIMSLALGARQLNLNNKYFNAVNGHIRVSTLVIMNLLI